MTLAGKKTSVRKATLLNLLMVGFLMMLFDGCFYRDPYVKLSGGYVIASISHSSPCELYLEPEQN